MKPMIAILMMLGGVVVAGQGHSHSWFKESEIKGKDAYGNAVVICTWECKRDYRNPHQQQTQGHGFCPMPR